MNNNKEGNPTDQWQKRKRKFAVRYLIAVCAIFLLFVGVFLFLYIQVMSYKAPEPLSTTNTVLDVMVFGLNVIGGVFSFLGEVALGLATIVSGILACVYVIVAIPSIVGCIGLLKNKKWAPVVILITSILHLLIFPIGTVLGIIGILFYQKYRVQEAFDPAGKVFKILAIAIVVVVVVCFKILFSPSKRFYEPTASEPLYDVCQTKRFGVKIDITHQGFRLNVSCKPFRISWRDIEIYTNGEKMKYTNRNDYDLYESFTISFENEKIPDDTLWFSIKEKGTLYQIGYASIKPLNQFQKKFPSDNRVNKDKNTVVWYEEADSLNIYRNYDYTDSAHIIRLSKNEAKSINLPSHFLEEVDDGKLPNIQFAWHKKLKGKITNDKLCGEIRAVADEIQTIRVER
ncbi:hypothetical protein WSM22_25000 [Cytophagales bacterium WSM2-2]|nr:hypothetical protein WSM22_25000 [Cytophagales bacterium WSM2-2]